VHRFVGNATVHDHFKLLRRDGRSILIGARNVVYNVSLDTLRENTEQVS
jgi:semaphorin 6